MSPEEIRSRLTSGDIAPPFTVHTTGGRSYPVTDVTNIWFPMAFPGTVAIAVPRRSIAILRLDAVDSITCEEHEAVRAHE